jgi:hypothetical protein
MSKTGRVVEVYSAANDGRGQLTASGHEERGHMGESTSDAALSIASLTEELARIAKAHGLETLAYLLRLARLEADQISKSLSGHAARPSGGKIDDV